MSETELNIKYICDKTLLDKDDELVPIILEMIKDSYKAGLNQSEFDNTMDLIEENQELKKQLEELSKQIDKWNKIYNDEFDKNKNQQKEFIKFLGEKEQQFDLECNPVCAGITKGYLSKYKKIIGEKDEQKEICKIS